MSLSVDQMLLISGTGRKSGKTTLACLLLNRFGQSREIIGLKISSHFHKPGPDLHVVKTTHDYRIYEEKDNSSGKDSSRMLQAGAAKSYYIQSKTEGLEHAINYFLENISKNKPIICESPALRSIVTPGVYIVTRNKEPNSQEEKEIENLRDADLILQFSGSFDDDTILSIQLPENCWKI